MKNIVESVSSVSSFLAIRWFYFCRSFSFQYAGASASKSLFILFNLLCYLRLIFCSDTLFFFRYRSPHHSLNLFMNPLPLTGSSVSALTSHFFSLSEMFFYVNQHLLVEMCTSHMTLLYYARVIKSVLGCLALRIRLLQVNDVTF